MARIRTIKPKFFTHGDLYDAEKATGLPLRVAYAGLWCASDREGRFEWRPRELKLVALPHDEVDFSRVLDALATRGYLVKYACENEEYGYIPTWRKHQIINNRESASVLPNPEGKDSKILIVTDASTTREARDIDASSTRLQGKGREGKGKEERKEFHPTPQTVIPPPAAPATTKASSPQVTPEAQAANAATRTAYCEEFFARYGIEASQGAAFNGMIAALVRKVGQSEAPKLARFYFKSRNLFYSQRGYSLELLLKDCDALRIEMATGNTPTTARPSLPPRPEGRGIVTLRDDEVT